MINSALIITSTQKSATFFTEVLHAANIKLTTVMSSTGEARRFLLDHQFDLIIVDTPLDESGEEFCRSIASRDQAQVILAVKSEHFGAVSAVCEEDGVLTVSKPINTDFFWAALSLAKSASSKIQRMQVENAKLKQKIEDIRIIDRAKCQLISYLNLSENEAHRFIEKQAMDLRSTKRSIAEEILKTYAS
jgi:response regulator NasT